MTNKNWLIITIGNLILFLGLGFVIVHPWQQAQQTTLQQHQQRAQAIATLKRQIQQQQNKLAKRINMKAISQQQLAKKLKQLAEQCNLLLKQLQLETQTITFSLQGTYSQQLHFIFLTNQLPFLLNWDQIALSMQNNQLLGQYRIALIE